MIDSKCRNCSTSLNLGDIYCPYCGLITGHIIWRLSPTKEFPANDQPFHLTPGAQFYLIARNEGLSPVKVIVDATQFEGAQPPPENRKTVFPQQQFGFIFQHQPNKPIAGALRMWSEDGKRRNWWDRTENEEHTISPGKYIRIVNDQWVFGSKCIVFPPGVKTQIIRIWNDSNQTREFITDCPVGYTLSSFGADIVKTPPQVNPHNYLDVKLQSVRTPGIQHDTVWYAGPDKIKIPIICISEKPNGVGKDAVVAIDYGTRNTRIRVRWRHQMLSNKPEHTVDSIGDKENEDHFPTAMIVDERNRTFYFGSDAQNRIDLNQFASGEHGIENLKTDIRNNVERYLKYNPKWTNEYLLNRYFEQVMRRMDDYFRNTDPNTPLFRSKLNIKYVITRPVIDRNEGDEKGRRYEDLFRLALMNHDIEPDDIAFVLEPEAATIGIAFSRQDELLSMTEGDPVAVIDAGGGTTDISLAKVSLQNGQVSLNVNQSIRVCLNSENPLYPMLKEFNITDEKEFGGNCIDCALAFNIMHNPKEILEADESLVPSSINPPNIESFPNNCRTYKEAASKLYTQRLYLSESILGKNHELKPMFPNDSELQDVFLDWGVFDENVFDRIFPPMIAEARQRFTEGRGKIQPHQIKKAFYVGGTNIDIAVRRRFRDIFGPHLNFDDDPEAQSDMRMNERLNAVVAGAVWLGEKVFHPCPLEFTVNVQGDERKVMGIGDALKSTKIPDIYPFHLNIDAGEEINVSLNANHTSFQKPMEVARAFYRNEDEGTQKLLLSVKITRENGVEAELNMDGKVEPMWKFRIVKDPK